MLNIICILTLSAMEDLDDSYGDLSLDTLNQSDADVAGGEYVL